VLIQGQLLGMLAALNIVTTTNAAGPSQTRALWSSFYMFFKAASTELWLSMFDVYVIISHVVMVDIKFAVCPPLC